MENYQLKQSKDEMKNTSQIHIITCMKIKCYQNFRTTQVQLCITNMREHFAETSESLAHKKNNHWPT